MTGCIVETTTTGSADNAQAIARALVEGRLAACVQVSRVRSTYEWEGSVTEDEEHLLTIKTTDAAYGAVEAAILGLHSYTLPEIVACAVVGGSEAYLGWVRSMVTA